MFFSEILYGKRIKDMMSFCVHFMNFVEGIYDENAAVEL
jgi:hypothetical protein